MVLVLNGWLVQVNIDYKTREALLAQLDSPNRNMFQAVGATI